MNYLYNQKKKRPSVCVNKVYTAITGQRSAVDGRALSPWGWGPGAGCWGSGCITSFQRQATQDPEYSGDKDKGPGPMEEIQECSAAGEWPPSS